MFNRRQFIQTSATTALGATVLSPHLVWASKNAFVANPNDINLLTPYFLAEDLLRLIQLHPFSDRFREALTVNNTHFNLGKVWQIPTAELLKVAQDSQSAWNSEMKQDRARTQYALVCGRIAHQVFDDLLQPDQEKELSERDIYRDVHVIKELQNADPHRKKVSIDQPIKGASEEEVAELFHVIQQRNMIRTHTLRPEFSDVSTWLDNFLGYYEGMKEGNKRYAAVYCSPEVSKVRTYISDAQFYEADDAPIQLARRFQMSQLTGKTNVLMTKKAVVSIYGKALQQALAKLQICDAYVSGGADEQAVRNAMK
jgi:hypothetical protein